MPGPPKLTIKAKVFVGDATATGRSGRKKASGERGGKGKVIPPINYLQDDEPRQGSGAEEEGAEISGRTAS